MIKINYNSVVDDLVRSALTEKTDFMRIILEISKIILMNNSIPDEKKSGTCYINNQNNRIFFSQINGENNIEKHFSFHFPFKVIQKEEQGYKYNLIRLVITDVYIQLDTISFILFLLNMGVFGKDSRLHNLFIDLPQLIGDDINTQKVSDEQMYDINEVIHELLMFEPSYLRFELDEVHDKTDDPDVHPLHHFDIFYTDRTTFKLGVNKMCKFDDFCNILDNYTLDKKCKYISI